MLNKWSAILLLVAFVVPSAIAADAPPLALTHVHGMSYSADGQRLMIPSHHGLAILENGRWSKAPGPQHDYMGFSAGAKAIYSSGHPAPGSGLANPFGLIRSPDGGKTWQPLGLEGESDFHLLATGWNTRAVYVFNPGPSSRIQQPGLHLTLDDGRTWKPARAAGLEGAPRALAAHPDDPAGIAVATSSGIYVSRDSGQTFRRIASGDGTAVFWDLDGNHLWAGLFSGTAGLVRTDVRDGRSAQAALPTLARDAVAFIAQNPVSRLEYAVATYQRTVLVTRDAGRTWQTLAEQGQAR